MGYPIYHSQYTAAQIEAAIGKGPRVNASGFWEVWNVSTGAYESTGVGAGVTPPTVVTQVSQMTNHGYIYIYNGTETGYTAGYWYYWDGSAWTAGGAYQVAATDTTLTVAGAAADAKATGDAVGELKSALSNKVVAQRTLLTSADDLNNIVIPGVYRWVNDNLPGNAPFASNATLIVYLATPSLQGNVAGLVQMAVREGNIAYRRGTNGVYSSWTKLQNEEFYDRILESSDDLNTLYEKGVYRWASSIPANAPYPEMSGVTLINFQPPKFSTYYVGMIQLAISDTEIYVRRNVTSADNIWGNWHNLSETKGRILESSDDLNTLYENGVYRWASSIPANAPTSSFDNASLIVFKTGAGVPTVPNFGTCQIAVRSNAVYIRRRETNWTEWLSLTGISIPLITSKRYDTSGTTVDISAPIDSNTFSCALIPCTKNDEFILTGTGGNASRLWCFLDSEGTILLTSPANSAVTNFKLHTCDNAAYLVVNMANSDNNHIEKNSSTVYAVYGSEWWNKFITANGDTGTNNKYISLKYHIEGIRAIYCDDGYVYSVCIFDKNSAVGTDGLYLNSNKDGLQEHGAYFTGYTSLEKLMSNLEYGAFKVNCNVRRADGGLINTDEGKHIHLIRTIDPEISEIFSVLTKEIESAVSKAYDLFYDFPDSTGAIGESVVTTSTDFQKLPFLGVVLVNVATKRYSIQNLKLIIDAMYEKGLHYLELMLTGNRVSFALNDPIVKCGPRMYDLTENFAYNNGGYYTEADMEDLIEYASGKGVEIIPQIEGPSHMLALLFNRSEMWYTGPNSHGNEDMRSINFNDPIALAYAFGIIEKYAKWFSERGTKQFSIASDEFYTSLTPAGYVSLYNMKDYGYTNYINNAAFIVSKYHMIPWAWSDSFMVKGNAYPFANRKIVLGYWHYDSNWATPRQLIDAGYKVVNCSEQSFYHEYDGEYYHLTPEGIRSSNIYTFAGNQTENDASGVKLCIWAGGNPDNNDGGDTHIQLLCELVEAFGDIVNAQKPATA